MADSDHQNQRQLLELIETLWNVNEDCKYCLKLDARELIETLWNVNIIVHMHGEALEWELIETLWNVNFYEYVSLIARITN